jgi:hypothetical protein
MIVMLVPFLVLLAGLFMYYLAANAKTQEVGRICFEVGLFIVLFKLGVDTVKLFSN